MTRDDARSVCVFALLEVITVALAFLGANASRANEPVEPPAPYEPPAMREPLWRRECRDDHTELCWGRTLYRQAGCTSCHSVNPKINEPGPSFGHAFGTLRTFEDGRSAVMDLTYLTRAIREPQAEIVRGYTTTQMNPYRLSDRQIRALAVYIESLAAPPPPPPAPPPRERRRRRR